MHGHLGKTLSIERLLSPDPIKRLLPFLIWVRANTY